LQSFSSNSKSQREGSVYLSKWECPVCGEEEYIQGVEPFELEPLNDGSGMSLLVPKKIWCMKCQKEYSVNEKEKVQFT
jgi:hypothetical protein